MEIRLHQPLFDFNQLGGECLSSGYRCNGMTVTPHRRLGVRDWTWSVLSKLSCRDYRCHRGRGQDLLLTTRQPHVLSIAVVLQHNSSWNALQRAARRSSCT